MMRLALQKVSITEDMEIAAKTIYDLNEERINEEAQYNVFYSVVTNPERKIEEILKINKRCGQIEENFRITQNEFEAIPVYIQRDERIKAHFLL